MDLTALELGLRNRQLLQVKCFLKIQVETFRYFLNEEFSRLPSDGERVIALDKFFAHDWQNVINKIVSVAVVNMTGDYFSKMFAILLFRSMVQACNQLLVIISTIDMDELECLSPNSISTDENRHLVRSQSYSSSSSSFSNARILSSHGAQTTVIKDKIFLILTRQIRSITKNLEKIHSSHQMGNSNEMTSNFSIDKDSIMMSSWLSSCNRSLPQTTVETPTSQLTEIKVDNVDECLRTMASHNQLPLFHYLLRAHRFVDDAHLWEPIVERVIVYVSDLLLENEMSIEFVQNICDILAQTGLPQLYLLFTIFIQTHSFQLRQKLLQLFLIKFDNFDTLQQSLVKEFESNDKDLSQLLNIETVDQLNLAKYLQIMSMIDLYIFCFRSKLDEADNLEISIKSILRLNEIAYVKSLILPSLYEIVVHFDLFNNWRLLNEHSHANVWNRFEKYFINENDFFHLVTCERLWQYLIDNQQIDSLVQWIESGHITLPYCGTITVDNENFDTCKRMVDYLLEESSFLVKHRLLGILAYHSSFFGQFSLFNLAPDRINFQTILTSLSHNQDLIKCFERDDIENIDLLSPFLRGDSSHFNITLLVDYCVSNRLYEFLYLIHNRHRDIFESKLDLTSLDAKGKSIISLLNALSQEVDGKGKEEEYLFKRSLILTNFLYDNEQHLSPKETIRSLMMDKENMNIELALMNVALSKDVTFDQFFKLIVTNDDDASNLTEVICMLKSKYPLIGKSFEEKLVKQQPATFLRSKVDIYSLLQQTIPFVNINQFFSWQLSRNDGRSRHSSTNTANSNVSLENAELPHFSQKRLTELYGLKAELTFSYYLKNSRFIEAFLHCFATKMNLQPSKTSWETKPLSINPKLALKAIRKAAQISYSSIRQSTVLAGCLLFQSLVQSASESPDCRRAYTTLDSLALADVKTLNEFESEMTKTRLHLALAKLIIEHAPDYLSLLSAQHQQSSLNQLLRKSHFQSDRNSAQKLLDLAAVAIDRKFDQSQQRQLKLKKDSLQQSSLNHRLHALLSKEAVDNAEAKMFEEGTNLLMECFEWKPMLMFADFHGLKRPLHFLYKCAKEDNWLIFTIFIQMHGIPKEEFQLVLKDKTFNNQCIGEHLTKAFQNLTLPLEARGDSRLFRQQTVDNSRRLFYSKLFKGKIAPNTGPIQFSPASSSPIEPGSIAGNEQAEIDILSLDFSNETPSGSPQSSMFSKHSDDSNVINLILYDHQLKPNVAIKDFLQLVLEIYQNCVQLGLRAMTTSDVLDKSFTATLLYAAVSLSNPTLALLACSINRATQTSSIQIRSPGSPLAQSLETSSEENNNPLAEGLQFTAFMVWLLARIDVNTKMAFINHYIDTKEKNVDGHQPSAATAECYLKWPLDKCHHLIDLMTQRDVNHFIVLSNGFKIFSVDIPIINKLLQFLIQFFIEKDYYQSSDLLKEFQTLLATYNEREVLASKSTTNGEESGLFDNHSSLNILYTKNWIERCSLTLVTNSLILAQQFELGILLSHYNYVRIQESFSNGFNRVPDIRRLYLFNQCLAKLLNFKLPISQILFQMPMMSGSETSSDLSDNADVHYVNIFRKLIFDLQQAGHFDEARNLINLLPKANINEFIINEWMLKAKQLEPTFSGGDRQFVQSDDGNEGDGDKLSNKIDIEFWENCWTQVTKLDPSMHSALKVMERFIEHLESNQMLLKCFLYHKCMLAIESILQNSINSDGLNESSNLDDASTVDSLNISVYDLVHDYFNFEYALWKTVIDCEHLVSIKRSQMMEKVAEVSSAKSNRSTSMIIESSGDHNVIDVWEKIFKEIVNYVKSSTISTSIMPILSKRYSFKFKSLESRTKKTNEQILLSTSQNVALSAVIRRLLSAFCIPKAKEVADLFDYSHIDFQIIQACDDAARGILRKLVDAPVDLQIKIQSINSLRMSSTLEADSEHKNTINIIQIFIKLTTIGRLACEQILLYFKISTILTLPYSSLVNYTSSQLFELLISSNKSDSKTAATTTVNLAAIHKGKFSNSNSSMAAAAAAAGGSRGESIVDELEAQSSVIHKSKLSNFMEAIACAKDLIKLVGGQDEALDNDEKIVDLLSKHILENVRQLVDQQFDSQQNDSGTEIELDKAQLSFNNDRFIILLRLLTEPSQLGHKLIDVCRKEKSLFEDTYESFINPRVSKVSQSYTAQSAQSFTESDFLQAKRQHHVLLVELYICAHECFTVQCNVRGIALVLKKTRLLIAQELQTERYFHLILRLLTGIGRYSEMTYCFDLFKEADRFEMILSKRVERTPQLRIALLNYIKNSEHIDELLPLVAIRFFLFRETADYHRTRAEQLLGKFYNQHFSLLISSVSNANRLAVPSLLAKRGSVKPYNDQTTLNMPAFNHLSTFINATRLGNMIDQLSIIMYEYQEGEANYQKASSYSNADYCSRRAQLVALQISYLNQTRSVHQSNALASSSGSAAFTSVIQLVLNLEPIKVCEFILNCNKFFEAYIVGQAYPSVVIDWADPFFNIVILNNNLTYLDNFIKVFNLSFSMLEKLVKRLEQVISSFRTNSGRSMGKDLYPSQQLQQHQQHSPSSFVLGTFMNHIRSDLDIQRSRKLLEQILERALISSNEDRLPASKTMSPLSKISLLNCQVEDKYRLAKRFNSPNIMKRLLESDSENNAYLFDLKRNNLL